MYHKAREKLQHRLSEREESIKAMKAEKDMMEIHIHKLQSMVSRLAEQCQTTGTRSGDSLIDSAYEETEDGSSGSSEGKREGQSPSAEDLFLSLEARAEPEIDAVVHADLPPIEFWMLNCPHCAGMINDI